MEFNAQARRVAIDALKSLSEEKHLLVYEKTTSDNGFKKQRIEVVDSLLKVTRSGRNFKIVPNPVLVDQIDS